MRGKAVANFYDVNLRTLNILYQQNTANEKNGVASLKKKSSVINTI